MRNWKIGDDEWDERLVRLRKNLGNITQKDLADLIHLDKSQIQRFEAGVRVPTSVVKLMIQLLEDGALTPKVLSQYED